MSGNEEQQASVAFVDDTDFFSVGVEVMENMIKILKTYTELFQAAGRRTQHKKQPVSAESGSGKKEKKK